MLSLTLMSHLRRSTKKFLISSRSLLHGPGGKRYPVVAFCNITDLLTRYTGTGMVSDVSYDLWLAPSVGAANKYEIMIWLGSYGGAGPISEQNKPAIAKPTIAGTTWSLFKGPNGDTTVFSFVAPSNIGNFKADLLPFLTYLTKNQGVPSSYVATSFQAGTEPFIGELLP